MRILISGAGGFIGRHLTAAMALNGHEVVALVRRRPPPELEQNASVRIEVVDLAQKTTLPKGPFDALLHCAAAIPSTVPDATELMRINIEGSRQLFAHAAATGTTFIMFCSSMSVYGRIGADVVNIDTPVREPNSYGRSKLTCEQLLSELGLAVPALRAVSIRLPGVIGPGSHDNFLSDIAARLCAGENVVVRNPDALFNNVLHVDDLVRFAHLLLESLKPGHRITTIAAEIPLPIHSVVGIIESALGSGRQLRGEHGQPPFLISNEMARSLGFEPSTVRQTVQLYASRYAMTPRK